MEQGIGTRSVDLVVDGDPAAVRERLRAGLLPIRSLWFPTLAELRRWDGATAPLYLRERRDGRLELGPRLANLQAARFAPMLLVRLTPEGHHRTRLDGRVAYPGFATGLLCVWGAVLVAWLAAGLAGTHEEGSGWLVWWVGLAVVLLLAAGLGWAMGGQALNAALPELARVARDPGAGADDWG